MELNTRNVAIILTVVFILFWVPFTRAAVIFILPLGSGIDDLVFIVAGVGAVVAWALHRTGRLGGMDRTRWIFITIVLSSLLLIGLFLWILGG